MNLRYVVILLVLLAAVKSRAQNLVPNGSFEEYNNCPSGMSGDFGNPSYIAFPTVKNWYAASFGTSDYFNACGHIPAVRTPKNDWGYQVPVTGQAYAGVYAYTANYQNSNLREYIGTQFTEPLKAGHTYCVSFYVSLARWNEGHITQSYTTYAIDAFGAFIGNPLQEHSTGVINVVPTIENPAGNMLPAGTWTRISGIYTANGTETAITIGNFRFDGSFGKTQVHTVPGAFLDISYYFIDEVSVVDISPAAGQKKIIYACSSAGISETLHAVNGFSYQWSTGATTPSIHVNDTGTYWCNVNTSCGQFTDTIKILYHPYTQLELGPDKAICKGQKYTIKALPGYDAYTWSNGGYTDSITVDVQGTYWVQVKDKCGVQSDTVRLTVHPIPAAPAVNDTTICQYVSNPLLQVQGNNLLWYTDPSAPGQVTQPVIATDSKGTQKIYVSTVANGCHSTISEINITIKPLPEFELEDKRVFCQARVESIRPNTVSDTYTYRWNTNVTTPGMVPPRPGTYTLEVTNECGTVADSVAVVFSDCENCLMIPNAFTPNSDGTNDMYRVKSRCPAYYRYSLHIYNRWGQNVFQTNRLDEYWDGTFKGQACEAGTYYYQISFQATTKQDVIYTKGDILLIR